MVSKRYNLLERGDRTDGRKGVERMDVIRLTAADDYATYVDIVPERGAIVANFIAKGRPVFYMDEEMGLDSPIIRGGNPILFPVCGAVRQGRFAGADGFPAMPRHGFARDLPWTVVAQPLSRPAGGSTITLQLKDSADTRRYFPYAFQLCATYTITSGTLRVETQLLNLSEDPMPFQIGFHPYFSVADKTTVSLQAEADDFIDTVAEVRHPGPLQQNVGPRLADPVTNLCVPRLRSSVVTLRADGQTIQMRLGAGLSTLVLWALAGKAFVCVEPWSGPPGEFGGDEEKRLAPGGEFAADFSIRAGSE